MGTLYISELSCVNGSRMVISWVSVSSVASEPESLLVSRRLEAVVRLDADLWNRLAISSSRAALGESRDKKFILHDSIFNPVCCIGPF
mmetsp:Transcript_7152/g.21135  ORF Transcript_7152/g.21135 Transcript_7152/m.21135 type:complete len:88 (+) Transcript_7152:616-879(+)